MQTEIKQIRAIYDPSTTKGERHKMPNLAPKAPRFVTSSHPLKERRGVDGKDPGSR